MKQKLAIIITILWIINEIFQHGIIDYRSFAIVFMISHVSSIYGAIIFCLLIAHLNLNRSLMLVPLAIEIFQSWFYCRCIDYWDLIFSCCGIVIVFVILVKENKQFKNNELYLKR